MILLLDKYYRYDGIGSKNGYSCKLLFFKKSAGVIYCDIKFADGEIKWSVPSWDLIDPLDR